MTDTALLIFSLAFFTFVVWIVSKSEQETYSRRINEMREFGHEIGQKRPRKTPQKK